MWKRIRWEKRHQPQTLGAKLVVGHVTEVELSGRVRDSASKGLLKQQLGSLGGNPAFLDLNTGAIKNKKAKKMKTPEQEVAMELKKVCNEVLSSKHACSISFPPGLRWKQLSNEIPKLLDDLETYHVRNCGELVT